MKTTLFQLFFSFFCFLSTLSVYGQTVELVGTDDPNFVNVNGNVGIGLTTPLKKLDVNGDILLSNQSGPKSIWLWNDTDANWRWGMGVNPGFTKSLVTAHSQFMTYGNSVGAGFAVGVNGHSSGFEIRGGDHQAYFRGNVGIGTTFPNSTLSVAKGLSVGFGSGVSPIHGARRSIQLNTDLSYGGNFDNHSGFLMYSTLPTGWGHAEMHFAPSTNWGTYDTANPVLSLDASSGIRFGEYGSGAFTGALAKYLGVTSSGQVIEVNAPTGGSGSYPAGEVVFGDATNGTNSESNLFWDATNNRLGIGTSNPLASLQIGGDEKIKLGTTIGTNKESGLYWFSSTNYSIRRGLGTWSAPDYQQLLVDWPTGIVLDPGTGNNAGYGRSFVEIKGGKGLRVTQGDVGIGTEDATAPLHIHKNPSGDDILAIFENSATSGEDAGIKIKGAKTSSTGNVSYVDFDIHDDNELNPDFTMARIGGGKRHKNGENGQLRFLTLGVDGLTEKMRIKDDGDVGIGTTNPGGKLEVNGDIVLRNQTGDRKQIYTWKGGNEDWRMGMHTDPGFERAITTSHVQYITYHDNSTQGFALGVNGGQSGFEIRGSDHKAYFRGKVGLGTTSPESYLQVGGDTPDTKSFITLGKSETSSEVNLPRILQKSILVPGASNDLALATLSGNGGILFYTGASGQGVGAVSNKIRMAVTNNGVGIGTQTPDAELTVKGMVHAEEYIADLNVPGPDYVFEPSHVRPSLSDLKQYVTENKHLPKVPSSDEMMEKGVNLLQMNMTLLEKVEELTLYLIEQNEKIQKLEKQVNELNKEE